MGEKRGSQYSRNKQPRLHKREREHPYNNVNKSTNASLFDASTRVCLTFPSSSTVNSLQVAMTPKHQTHCSPQAMLINNTAIRSDVCTPNAAQCSHHNARLSHDTAPCCISLFITVTSLDMIGRSVGCQLRAAWKPNFEGMVALVLVMDQLIEFTLLSHPANQSSYLLCFT